MIRVVVVAEAEQQLREIHSWWEVNRAAAPTLVVDEVERCITLLAHSPDIGTLFRRALVPGTRRIVLRKTRHHVYYLHDESRGVVYVLAIWGTPKEGDPPLRDPR